VFQRVAGEFFQNDGFGFRQRRRAVAADGKRHGDFMDAHAGENRLHSEQQPRRRLRAEFVQPPPQMPARPQAAPDQGAHLSPIPRTNKTAVTEKRVCHGIRRAGISFDLSE
jgi:hypothetical protein